MNRRVIRRRWWVLKLQRDCHGNNHDPLFDEVIFFIRGKKTTFTGPCTGQLCTSQHNQRWKIRIIRLWLSDDVARLHVEIDYLNASLVGFCFIRSIDDLGPRNGRYLESCNFPPSMCHILHRQILSTLDVCTVSARLWFLWTSNTLNLVHSMKFVSAGWVS
jgi:hypothetical protein